MNRSGSVSSRTRSTSAATLDVTVVGAGCEDEDDLRLLLELGCDSVTGGFIAEAMPGEELPGWVASWDPERLVVGGDR